MLRNKYKAKAVYHDGKRFASIKEGKRYLELKMLKESGVVKYFQRQTPWDLPGGIRYLLDFQVKWSDGSETFEDVKGMRTEIYKLKKKQVEALYPITITEI